MAIQISKISVDADRALLEGQVPALVATFYQNERPPGGLAGLLDWRFRGLISNSIRAGAITGQSGECVYLPVSHRGATYHVILVGGGTSEKPGRRGKLSENSWTVLQKNLASLKFSQVALSQSDFGDASDETFTRNLKGVPVCLVR